MSEGWKGPESEKALNMRWGGGKVKEVLEVPGKVIWVEQSIFFKSIWTIRPHLKG